MEEIKKELEFIYYWAKIGIDNVCGSDMENELKLLSKAKETILKKLEITNLK